MIRDYVSDTTQKPESFSYPDLDPAKIRIRKSALVLYYTALDNVLRDVHGGGGELCRGEANPGLRLRAALMVTSNKEKNELFFIADEYRIFLRET